MAWLIGALIGAALGAAVHADAWLAHLIFSRSLSTSSASLRS